MFDVSGSSFFREIYGEFFAAVKDINLEKSEKTAFANYTFFVFKIRIPQGAMRCENFGRFYREKFKKIINKTIKK